MAFFYPPDTFYHDNGTQRPLTTYTHTHTHTHITDRAMPTPTPFRVVLRRQTTTGLRSRLSQNHHHQRRAHSDAPKPKRAEDPIPVPNTVSTIPLWQRLGPLTRAAEGYARAQRKRPLTTQLISSLVIYFCADLSAQNMSGSDYNPERTMRSLTIGAISSIPSYKWYVVLSRRRPSLTRSSFQQ